ncbi:apoptosis-resistant E3 ubiquitin protein ligase 1-like [Dendronephthya gigantea]|uniref:apoptosis-resistant E3 ubiquitin protein ligase 1-like n=1 Tax=Dendronephthya gigantea TaxID=151771 RepID=UPI00106BCCEF|nr:apoptosis-resistant E3 ubiquitin protein ligase 1-like [Dendronephthya gigantea]
MSGLGPLLNLIRNHPNLTEPLLVFGNDKPPTEKEFLALVEFEDVDDKHKEFFTRYVTEESERLSELLMFATGSTVIPPMGFSKPSTITVLQNGSSLPNANTCPMELEVPGLVATYEEFRRNMNCALDNQKEGFGII